MPQAADRRLVLVLVLGVGLTGIAPGAGAAGAAATATGQSSQKPAAEGPMDDPMPTPPTPTPPTPTPQRVFAAASPAVVAIIVRDAGQNVIARSTGFFISADGTIVTALSPLRGVHSAVAVLENNAMLPIERVVAQDATANVALLSTAGRNLPHLKLSPAGSPKVGSRIFAVAAPPEFDHTLDAGIVGGYKTTDPARPATMRIRTSLNLSPESTGAPLLDEDGAVVGVTSGTASDHTTLATPVITIDALLRQEQLDAKPAGPIAAVVIAVTSDTAPAGASRTVTGESVPVQPPVRIAAVIDETEIHRYPANGAPEPVDADAAGREKAAKALARYAGGPLEPGADDGAMELGLRLAEIQRQLAAMGPTLEQIAQRAMRMSDAADRIARRSAGDDRVVDAALAAKLEGSQIAFDARHAAKVRVRLDTVQDYERHLVFGGDEGFGTYLRARQVAAIPAEWRRIPLGIPTGRGLWVSEPLFNGPSYRAAYDAPPTTYSEPVDPTPEPTPEPSIDLLK